MIDHTFVNNGEEEAEAGTISVAKLANVSAKVGRVHASFTKYLSTSNFFSLPNRDTKPFWFFSGTFSASTSFLFRIFFL